MQKKPVYKPPFKKPNNTSTVRKPYQPQKDTGGYNINRDIRAASVRLIREGHEPIVIGYEEAYDLAQQAELDLVEISPNANPPVCKILDFQKFLYEKRKKEKENNKNKTVNIVKEIKIGPTTAQGDLDFKSVHAKNFLEKGHRIKITMFFKGRMIAYKEQGMALMLKFANDLEEHGKAENMPKHEGKFLTMFLSPNKKK